MTAQAEPSGKVRETPRDRWRDLADLTLPDTPAVDVDADEWTFHHRVLYRIILAAPRLSTGELQQCYEALSPVVYQGVTKPPADSKSYRRKLLRDLADGGVVSYRDTPHGRVWHPVVGGGQ